MFYYVDIAHAIYRIQRDTVRICTTYDVRGTDGPNRPLISRLIPRMDRYREIHGKKGKGI